MFADFDASEQYAVGKILERAEKDPNLMEGRERLDVAMDLAAVHHHTPLRLMELAEADDFNFNHDMYGIRNHLDRETGELRRFVPRFARPTRTIE